MMTDLERTGGLPWALRRNRSARVRPPTPRAPTRRKSRRERPSHIRLAIGLLRKVNMACSFEQVGSDLSQMDLSWGLQFNSSGQAYPAAGTAATISPEKALPVPPSVAA